MFHCFLSCMTNHHPLRRHTHTHTHIKSKSVNGFISVGMNQYHFFSELFVGPNSKMSNLLSNNQWLYILYDVNNMAPLTSGVPFWSLFWLNEKLTSWLSLRSRSNVEPEHVQKIWLVVDTPLHVVSAYIESYPRYNLLFACTVYWFYYCQENILELWVMTGRATIC